MEKVSVIILNYKQKELTVNCIKSVLVQDYKDFDIILVDNASQDGSVELFKKEFSKNKKIKIVESRENTGYTGGNNLGYKFAKGEYVVVLNNDTIVGKNWLAELVKAIKSKKNIGAVCSHIIEKYKENLDTKGKGIASSIIGYSILFKKKEKYFEPFVPSGTSFIIKRGILKEIFPEDYFIYSEEVYLGWLLRLKGYRILVNDRSVVNHFHSAVRRSNKKLDRHFTFLGERNRIANIFIFPSAKNIIKILPIMIIGIIARNVMEIRKIPYRLYSYLWLIFNFSWAAKKRKIVQMQRKVNDSEIIRYLSCKFYEPEFFKSRAVRAFVKIMNSVLCRYCWVVRLKTREFSQD